MCNIILWGTGVIYNTHLNVLKLYEKTEEVHIVGVTSNDLSGYEKLDGYQVYKPEMIRELDFDYLMIMNQHNFLDIVNKAMGLGVPKEKIISYRAIEIPNLNFDDYFKLKSKQISIITNNCWGGIVYKKLGLECLSPFKNLFLEDDDYIKLLSDLESYMQMPLEFAHYQVDAHSEERYPVMKLGDIYIHCNHDKYEKTAKENWERRKEKINYDALFIEMYTEDKVIAEQFSALEKYKSKICFVPFETDIPCCMQLKQNGNQEEFWEVVNNNPTKGTTYNLIDLLNMKKTFRMK